MFHACTPKHDLCEKVSTAPRLDLGVEQAEGSLPHHILPSVDLKNMGITVGNHLKVFKDLFNNTKLIVFSRIF